MTSRRLFIFVEGGDDQRFFSRIVVPFLESRYASVEIITYACMKSVKVCRFITSITAMDHEFILCGDIDQERNVKAKKAVLRSRFCGLSDDRIVVIIQEIESWYLAGLDEVSQKRLALQPYRSTNHITKELFNRLIPRFYTSRIAFMAEILDHFSIEIARERNRSFNYFSAHFMDGSAAGFVPGRAATGVSKGRDAGEDESPVGSAGERQVEPGPDGMSGQPVTGLYCRKNGES
jgi:hypothetical protein